MTVLLKVDYALHQIVMICETAETTDVSAARVAIEDINAIAIDARAALLGKAGLTPRQAICKQAIADYTERHGYAPTMNDLAALMGLASKGYVCRVIKLLVERGHVRHLSGKARSLEVL